MEALASGPLGRAAIAAAMRPKVSRRVRYFMENSWSHVRVPVADGLICYGGGEGHQGGFFSVDHWVPKLQGEEHLPSPAPGLLVRKNFWGHGAAGVDGFLDLRGCAHSAA